MENQSGSIDEAMFDYIDQLPATPTPHSNVRFTPAGIRQMSRLDKTGLRLLLQMLYFNSTKADHSKSLETVEFVASGSNDLVDNHNILISPYQQRRRGIKNLIQNGFLKPVEGRKDAWRLNADYISLQRSIKALNKAPTFSTDKSYTGKSNLGPLFAT